VQYKVIYSERKTVAISIENCEAVVKAPIGTDEETIRKIVLKHSQWIEKHMEQQKRKASMFKELTEDDIKAIKKDAKRYFTAKTEYYAKIMGIDYGRITITSAQKRFGSCSSKGNISFSYRLMLYPEVAREYVIVHELAHRREMNHSKRFYDVIAKVMPDYKYRKRLLK
jgi:predicted metal-dependent hydrolase